MTQNYVGKSQFSKGGLKTSGRATLWLRLGLTSLFLSLLLSSCATTPLPPVKQTEVIPVPKALTALTPDPMEGVSLSGFSNGRMFSLLKVYQSALASCNADKSLIETFLTPQ